LKAIEYVADVSLDSIEKRLSNNNKTGHKMFNNNPPGLKTDQQTFEHNPCWPENRTHKSRFWHIFKLKGQGEWLTGVLTQEFRVQRVK